MRAVVLTISKRILRCGRHDLYPQLHKLPAQSRNSTTLTKWTYKLRNAGSLGLKDLLQKQSSSSSFLKGKQGQGYFNNALQRRRRYIPEIPENTALYGLMGGNLAVFLLWQSNPGLALKHFTTSIDAVKAGRVHTLLTCIFSQRDTWHLASNMIGLYFFGRSCAYVLGGGGLVVLYMVGGVIGNIVYVTGQHLNSRGQSRDLYERYYSFKADSTPALGSSGAINSIVMFDILMAPTATVLIYGILPIHAWILGGLFLYQDISGVLGYGNSSIGYTAHLAGTAVGALTFWGVRRGKIPTQWRRW